MAKKSATPIKTEDAQTLEILKTHGIDLALPGVQSIKVADIERQPDSQSRIGNTPSWRVNELAAKWKAEAPLPPIIVWEDGVEGYLLVDGNTRTAAKRKAYGSDPDVEINAYVVDLKSKTQALVLSAVFNAQGPMPLNRAERKRAILANMDLGGDAMSAKTLARDFGFAPAEITRITKTQRAKDRLSGEGLNIDGLTDTALRQINELGDDAVRQEAVDLVRDAQMVGTDITALVKEIKTKGSEAERLKVVADERTARDSDIEAAKVGKVVKGSPVTQAAMAYGRMNALIRDYSKPADWVPSDADRRREAKDRITTITDFLSRVLDAIDVADSVSE